MPRPAVTGIDPTPFLTIVLPPILNGGLGRMLVVDWAEFTRQAPDLAASGLRLLGAKGDLIGFIATVARDGRPRMAPVCPILTQGAIYLSVGQDTPKRSDLANDGRYVLHAFLGRSDEEFQVSGRATSVTDAGEKGMVHSAIAFTFDRTDPMFVLDIQRGYWSYWENAGLPGTDPVKKRWSAE